MQEGLVESLSLIDVSGYVIISTIIALLLAGVTVTLVVRGRYARLEREIERARGLAFKFEAPVLNRIVAQAEAAQKREVGSVNTQAIVDDCFQAELKGLLIGERFVKSSTGLLIIFGLVGTFYGLTLSIGKLVALISGDVDDGTSITIALTEGLTRALTGMSVAFSSSLFGIVSAIIMTLLSVFANVGDRRAALMTRIESFVDNVLLHGAGAGAGTDARVAAMVEGFGQSVAQLQATVVRFETALQTFSTTTRDFREFNLHLRDNVQRMSLSFGDLSESLKERVRDLRSPR